MTKLQVNAILVILILAGFGGALVWMMLAHNGTLPDGRFMFLGVLVKDIILALIGAMWFFARQGKGPGDD